MVLIHGILTAGLGSCGRFCFARGYRHRVWRAGRACADRLQICHRLLKCQHMGCASGPHDLNQIGVTGAVLQMFSHGIIAGLLFAIVGRIVYERTIRAS